MRSVDVVIPCWGRYNKSLAPCLYSVPSAAVANIIVVGDDEARETADAFGAQTVLLPEGYGIGPARMLGLRASTSEFICFLDADDRIIGSSWTELARTLERHPGVIAVTGRLKKMRNETSWPPLWDARITCSRWGATLLLFRNTFASVGACVMRRAEVTEGILFPDLEDEDWHASVYLRVRGRVLFEEKYGIHYDTSPGSVSRSKRNYATWRFSHEHLISSALKAGASPRAVWRILNRVARVYRDRRRHRAIGAWPER